MATRTRASLKLDSMRDFSGGPNLRDAPPEFALNEGGDAWNVMFDERGGVTARLGYAKFNTTLFGSSAPIRNIYWSSMLGALITQAGASLYKGASTTAAKTFTTAARADFAEMAGLVIAAHPVDGLFKTSDAVTWTAVGGVGTPTKCDALAVWQNKLWVNDRTGANPSRVYFSNAGAPDAFGSTSFVDLREKDNEQVVAFHISSGQDVLGRAGLLAFKQESFYRINDSGTGAFLTVDATQGAASALAVIGVGPKIYFLNKHGIFWWQEGQRGANNASDLFLPLWDPSQVNLGQLDLWCAGRRGNRVRFSLTRAGSLANDLAIEHHPDYKWLAPCSNAMSCYASSTGTSETNYGGSPTVNGQVYQLGQGGTDDGAAIFSRFRTRWVEPAGGFKASLWQIRLHGRGAGTMKIVKDYASSGGTAYPFNMTGGSNLYDSGLFYDSGVLYSTPAYSYTQPFYTPGACRSFSIELSASGTTVSARPPLFGTGVAPVAGAWALYGLEWLYTPMTFM